MTFYSTVGTGTYWALNYVVGIILSPSLEQHLITTPPGRLASPVYKWVNWGTERWTNLLTVTAWFKGKAWAMLIPLLKRSTVTPNRTCLNEAPARQGLWKMTNVSQNSENPIKTHRPLDLKGFFRSALESKLQEKCSPESIKHITRELQRRYYKPVVKEICVTRQVLLSHTSTGKRGFVSLVK